MSATVTTGRRAGAFRAPSGDIIYVLFEQTYEKNVYPHTPSWSCVGIGRISEAMRRIFLLASSCEGGMLQNRGGWIAPENYLRSWMRELLKPFEMSNDDYTLRVGEGFYDSMSEDDLPKVEAALSGIGRSDIADQLRDGKSVFINLYRDIDMVLALYGSEERILSPWHLVRHYPAIDADKIDASLRFKPSPAAYSASVFSLPVAYCVGERDLLIRQADGSFRNGGWEYSIVQEFIKGLWKEALRSPKECYQRIRAYRAALHEAPQVPFEAVRVVFDANEPLEYEHQASSIAEFKEKFSVTETPTGFEVSPTEENFLSLHYSLPTASTRWYISTARSAAA